MKKILATVTAVVLSLAMVAMPSVAMADEVESTETPTTETVTEAVTPEPAPEPAPAAEPEPEPEAAPAETPAEPETTTVVAKTETVIAKSNENSNNNSNNNNNNSSTTEDDGKKCPADYLKPDELDQSSGTYVMMDGTTVIGTLTWEGDTVEYDLEPGWTIDLCVKSGSQSTEEGDDKVTEFLGLTGSGDESILQEISHLEYRATFTTPTSVTADADFVDEKCDVESQVLTKGVITVDITTGVIYSITQGGNPVSFDPITGETGELTAGLTYIVTATAAPTYVLTDPDYEESFTVTDDSEDCDEVEATEVTAESDFVDESCDEESLELTQGVITVKIKTGVIYSITQNGNPVPFDGTTGETGPLTSGLEYIVTATAAPNFVLTNPGFEDKYTPTSAAIDCETLGLVTPKASKDPGCELPSFYVVSDGLPGDEALTWTANGQEIKEGKHNVNGPATIELVATANGPKYGLEDNVKTTWTFKFAEDKTCGELTTLALTGATDTTPALALTAFLGLLGLAMVRSGIRVNRSRQEA
jgi:hypothetical protein